MSTHGVDDLTLDAVRTWLAGDGDPELLQRFDQFAGAGLVVGAAVTGSPAPLALIGPKNELVKFGKGLIRRFTDDAAPTSAERLRRLEAAHELLVLTAFFEASESVFDAMGRANELNARDRRWLAAQSRPEAGVQTPAVALPHPADGLARKAGELMAVYDRMARHLNRMLVGLSAWEQLDEVPRGRADQAIRALPALAVDTYCGQLVALATDVPEYAAWLTVKADGLLMEELKSLGTTAAKLAAGIERSEQDLDVGLCRLEQAVSALPARARAEQAERVVEGLRRAYVSSVQQSILKRQPGITAAAELHYPTKAQAFVPQAHKVLRTGRATAAISLESDEAWEDEPTQENLPDFLLSYLSSPFSAHTPMLVLGNPGSGKSLLTELLAARLATPAFNCVRIELRDVEAGGELHRLLQQQIERDTGLEVRWADFSEHISSTPPVVIFDGFDELLQASGKVHADFLNKVQAFQEREAEQGRPVRAIVTSRITLIDRAAVPVGSVVVRLMDFDGARQRRWAEIWNRQNADYFKAREVTPFEVPDDGNVMELAKQPLLLLMLALYDSEDNQLARQRGLDRTRLYDNLLRQFVRRERSKDGVTLPKDKLEALVDIDMGRLRAAAIGMYNRRSLHLRTTDLDRDIGYLGAGRAVPDSNDELLTQADLLLGSFFFVHQSESSSGAGTAEGLRRVAAFEFLHNTFGEFLTADFVLVAVLPRIASLMSMLEQPDLQEQAQLLLDQDTLPTEWFVALMHAPLCERPVIVEMLREWCHHRVRDRGADPAKLAAAADRLIGGQLENLANGEAPAKGLLPDGRSPYPAASLLERSAVYALNLVLVWSAVADVAEVRPRLPLASWETLAALWRTKFTMAELSALVSLVVSEEEEGWVMIDVSTAPSSGINGLEGVFRTARLMRDDVLAPLAGLHLQDTWATGPESLAALAAESEAQDFGLELAVLLRRVRRRMWDVDQATLDALEPYVQAACGMDRFGSAHRDLLVLLAHPDAPMALRQIGNRAFETTSLADLSRTSESYALAFMRFVIGDPSAWRGMLEGLEGQGWPSPLAAFPRAFGFVLRSLPVVPSVVLNLDLASLVTPQTPYEILASLTPFRELPFEQATAEAAIDLLIARDPTEIFAAISPEAMRALIRAAVAPARHEPLIAWLVDVDEDDIWVARGVWLSLIGLRGGLSKSGEHYSTEDAVGDLVVPVPAFETRSLVEFLEATKGMWETQPDPDAGLQLTPEMVESLPISSLPAVGSVIAPLLRPELREHLERLIEDLDNI